MSIEILPTERILYDWLYEVLGGYEADLSMAVKLISDLKKEIREEARIQREALLEIKNKYGKVCSDFDICTHESCRSSYSAWQVADAATK